MAPDSAHWANWIDAALSEDTSRQREANRFCDTLLALGRVPFLSWHHLEELLSLEDREWALRRIAFIKSLPMISFIRLPFEQYSPGGVVEILTAEVLAAYRGAHDLAAVRDEAKSLLLRMGSGIEAIGEDTWVWDVVRDESLRRQHQSRMITALSEFAPFKMDRPFGEVAKGRMRTGSEAANMFGELHAAVLKEIRGHGDKRINNPTSMAGEFIDRVKSTKINEDLSVRDFLTIALLAQGIEISEIRDDILLSELNELAEFRAKLKIVSTKTGISFDSLKAVDRKLIPSWQIERALKLHGQKRPERKGSDLIDTHLMTLAPYVEEIFVDKRTAEDIRRVCSKNTMISQLIGKVRKASRYQELATGTL